MKYFIKPLREIDAAKISRWTYKEPYSFYNMGQKKEVIEELLNKSYYVMKNEKDKVVGFFCFGEAAQISEGKKFDAYRDYDIVDIGLGMRPDLTGQGKGIEFLYKGLVFAKKKFSNTKFRLTVATFNQRAIKVYKKAGFKEKIIFKIPKDKNLKTDIEFMTMELNFKIPSP